MGPPGFNPIPDDFRTDPRLRQIDPTTKMVATSIMAVCCARGRFGEEHNLLADIGLSAAYNGWFRWHLDELERVGFLRWYGADSPLGRLRLGEVVGFNAYQGHPRNRKDKSKIAEMGNIWPEPDGGPTPAAVREDFGTASSFRTPTDSEAFASARKVPTAERQRSDEVPTAERQRSDEVPTAERQRSDEVPTAESNSLKQGACRNPVAVLSETVPDKEKEKEKENERYAPTRVEGSPSASPSSHDVGSADSAHALSGQQGAGTGVRGEDLGGGGARFTYENQARHQPGQMMPGGPDPGDHFNRYYGGNTRAFKTAKTAKRQKTRAELIAEWADDDREMARVVKRADVARFRHREDERAKMTPDERAEEEVRWAASEEKRARYHVEIAARCAAQRKEALADADRAERAERGEA